MRAAAVSGVALLGVVAACSSFSSETPIDTTPDAAIDSSSREPVVADSAPVDAGPEPVSIISPYRDGGLVYPEKIVWTLSAANDAIIHYTIDGTDPTATSKSASGTVILQDLLDGTVIKWTIGSFTDVHAFVVHIDGPDGGSSRNDGIIFQNFRFEMSTAAITTVPKGVASITVHAGLRFWNGNGCPSCIDVLTVGIEKPSDCIGGLNPGLYRGATFSDQTFKVTVPSKAGVYPIRIGFSEVFDCDQALQQGLSDIQIGVLIVTP